MNWIQKLLEAVKTPNKSNQDQKKKLSNTGKLVKSEQPSGLLTQEIGGGVFFGCESTNVSTVRPVKSCVPVSVERLDKDQDADENVDADQISTVRVVRGQPIGLFTQLEETDIDFRVWTATCSCENSRKLPCSRSREEDRESSSSRSSSSRLVAK